MAKKTNFSQKTKKRPRLTYSKSVGALQIFPLVSTEYYTHWAVIRHLCKRDGYIIHILPAAWEVILSTPKLTEAKNRLQNLGFSFQINPFLIW